MNEAANALHTQGIRPTVTRVRSILGGGSPNDLTPALKQWRDTLLPTLRSATSPTLTSSAPLPVPIADLTHELWQRALAAAVFEVKDTPGSRDLNARTAEAQSLRDQLISLRDQLQREAHAYGELRAQAARHEVIAREALAQAHSSEVRERDLLRDIGSLRQRVAELEASVEQRRPARRRGATKATGVRYRPKLKLSKPKRPKRGHPSSKGRGTSTSTSRLSRSAQPSRRQRRK